MAEENGKKKTRSRRRNAYRGIAEKAVGHALPSSVQVHHVNGDCSDDRPENLVICQDRKYHALLHYRQSVIASGHDPDIEKRCSLCKKYKPLTFFIHAPRRSDGYRSACTECNRKDCRDRYRSKHKIAFTKEPYRTKQKLTELAFLARLETQP